MTQHSAIAVGLSISAGLFALLAAVAMAQSGSTIERIAIDANPAGNTATSLGTIDGCARVEPGAEIAVDVVVDAIPEDRRMIAFETRVTYDPALLEVVANNYDDFLLAAEGTYQPFAHQELNDTLPDSDGTFITAVVDLASNDTPGSSTEAGPGVLNRVTFKAKAAGVSRIGIDFNPEQQVYPLVVDQRNNEISIGQRGSAAIAVGQECPADAVQPVFEPLPPIEELFPTEPATPTPEGQTPTPVGQTPDPDASDTPTPGATDGTATPTGTGDFEEGDGDSDTGGIIIAGVLGALGAASTGSGGWLLYRRSKRPL